MKKSNYSRNLRNFTLNFKNLNSFFFKSSLKSINILYYLSTLASTCKNSFYEIYNNWVTLLYSNPSYFMLCGVSLCFFICVLTFCFLIKKREEKSVNSSHKSILNQLMLTLIVALIFGLVGFLYFIIFSNSVGGIYYVFFWSYLTNVFMRSLVTPESDRLLLGDIYEKYKLKNLLKKWHDFYNDRKNYFLFIKKNWGDVLIDIWRLNRFKQYKFLVYPETKAVLSERLYASLWFNILSLNILRSYTKIPFFFILLMLVTKGFLGCAAICGLIFCGEIFHCFTIIICFIAKVELKTPNIIKFFYGPTVLTCLGVKKDNSSNINNTYWPKKGSKKKYENYLNFLLNLKLFGIFRFGPAFRRFFRPDAAKVEELQKLLDETKFELAVLRQEGLLKDKIIADLATKEAQRFGLKSVVSVATVGVVVNAGVQVAGARVTGNPDWLADGFHSIFDGGSWMLERITNTIVTWANRGVVPTEPFEPLIPSIEAIPETSPTSQSSPAQSSPLSSNTNSALSSGSAKNIHVHFPDALSEVAPIPNTGLSEASSGGEANFEDEINNFSPSSHESDDISSELSSNDNAVDKKKSPLSRSNSANPRMEETSAVKNYVTKEVSVKPIKSGLPPSI